MFLPVVSDMASVQNGFLRVACNSGVSWQASRMDCVACNSECHDQQHLLHLEKISVTASWNARDSFAHGTDNFAHDPQIRYGHAHIRHTQTHRHTSKILMY